MQGAKEAVLFFCDFSLDIRALFEVSICEAALSGFWKWIDCELLKSVFLDFTALPKAFLGDVAI